MGGPDLIPLAGAVLHVEREPERVLEIGCGEGEGTLFLAREYPRARVRGVDPSAEAIRAAAARIGLDPEGRVAFKVGRRGSLPFPDDHFDLVVQRQDRLGAAEVTRVMRPGGALIVASAAGWRRAWVRRRLAGRGFETVVEGDAFLVTRLPAGP